MHTTSAARGGDDGFGGGCDGSREVQCFPLPSLRFSTSFDVLCECTFLFFKFVLFLDYTKVCST